MRIRGGDTVFVLAIALSAVPAAAQESARAPVVAVAQAQPAAALPVAEPGPPPKRRHAKGDSLEGFNRAMFSVHQVLDRIVFRPVALAYKTVVPNVARKGIRHFFANLGEPLVFANDVLQLKPKRAVKTFGRFLINSTVGIGGVMDVAKTNDFRLPHHDNSFGDTLGRYGVGPGPYIFLPLVGPSDLRDLGAGIAQGQVLPFTIGTPFDRAEYRVSETVLTGLDLRAESDDALKALLGSAIDPYATLRSAYLQDRKVTIDELRHGAKPTTSALDDPLTDPAGATEPAPTDDFPADPAPPVDPAQLPAP